ncbi:MAG: undecaprenyl-phosphate galactose phosphotransferase WbaP [Nitrospiraceae bacterium]|nr:undecaprenyl-phosphate galactose phosphotransferase WbaP [Nitrospiraceae bacterium]
MILGRAKGLAGFLLLLAADFLALVSIFYVSSFVRAEIIPLIYSGAPPFHTDIRAYEWIFPLWIGILFLQGGYTKRFTFWDEVKLLCAGAVFMALATFAVLFIAKKGPNFSRLLILTMLAASLFLFPAARLSAKKIIYSMGLLKRRLLIIGAGDAAVTALSLLRSEKNLGYDVICFLNGQSGNSGTIEGLKVYGFLDRADAYMKKGRIEDVLIAYPEIDGERLANLVNRIQPHAENILYLPDISGLPVLGARLRHFFKEQAFLIEMKNSLARPGNYFTKRLFDFLAGSILFVLLLLPILFISAIIRITSKGPAILEQVRLGKNGVPFRCYKFRTMLEDAEDRLKEILKDPEARRQWETYWKLEDDPRVTGFGRFLRKTSLDELPQIMNVLKGEMSLVGPRPYLEREREHLLQFEETILRVPPGITGLWQTSGRSDKPFPERLALDAWYVRNWSLWLDIVILLKTVRAVALRHGAM